MRNALRGGVLVAGSLFWDVDGGRFDWREEWLSIANAKRVTAPIRYGRLSKSRSCTYTMVFSRACERSDYAGGVGVAVPFRSSTENSAWLEAAAHALWAAETKGSSPAGRVAASWGAVGLLPNPEREVEDLLTAWNKCVAGQPSYSAPSHLMSEGPVLDEATGRLVIRWPRTLGGEPLDLDFLLATATDPELLVPGQRYPSAARIAAAWIADRDQNARRGRPQDQEVRYFIENRRHGICTFQDELIRGYLSGAGIESV